MVSVAINRVDASLTSEASSPCNNFGEFIHAKNFMCSSYTLELKRNEIRLEMFYPLCNISTINHPLSSKGHESPPSTWGACPIPNFISNEDSL